MKLKVTSVTALYTNTQSRRGVSPRFVHSLIQGHLPGNAAMKYTVIDKHSLIQNHGSQRVSLRPLTGKELHELKQQPTTSQWYAPNIQVYTTQWAIDVNKYFKAIEWPEALDHWVTEKLEKDQRLVDCFKSLVIPLSGDPTHVQHLNAHAIWLNNTGAGRSFYAYLLGSEPKVEPTEAGAIGSYTQTRNGNQVNHGFLHGEGFPVLLDEINTNNRPLIQKLLTYIENGKVTRALKEPIPLEGTKTVILAGNPKTKDMTASLIDFIAVVCTIDEPARIGRRFGYLLLGNDYKRVTGYADGSQRETVFQVIETVVKQYSVIIQTMVESQMEWVLSREPDIEDEIIGFANAVPNGKAAEFVRGQSYGCVKKLKMAAVRYIILQQLDKVPTDTVDFDSREAVFEMLLDINRDSWRKLMVIRPPGLSDQEWVIKLKKDHPSYSLRDIAAVADVSHTTVKNLLDEQESMEAAPDE